jgi:hypothetical protein
MSPSVFPFTETLEVIDFDGEYYTLNYTATRDDTSESSSILEKIRKNCFSPNLISLNTPAHEMPNNTV